MVVKQSRALGASLLVHSIVVILWLSKNDTIYQRAINSVVECLPYKQKVTGSNPVLPNKNIIDKLVFFLYNYMGLSSKGLGQEPSKFLM